MKKRILSILLALCMLFCLVPTTAFAADCAEDLVDPVIWIHLSSDGGGYYDVLNGTWTAADFFQPGKAPKGAKITAVTPPTSPSIPVSVNVNSDGTLNCTKTENTTEPVPKSETYTVTITSDDYAPISAPLTVRQYLNAGFRGPVYFDDELLYGDTYTYTCRVNNPGENGVWSALIQDPQMFEIYKETTDTTSEPGKSIYTVHIRAIKAGARITCIDFLYVSDTTMASSKVSRGAVTGGAVRTRPLTVTAGSATITEGNALPTDLVTCTGLLNSEGRKDDRDTVLDNALGYQLLDANNEEVTAATARNMPGTYTVVPAATLKSGWGERYSLNKVNGTLTVENQPDEQFTLAPGGRYYFDLSAMNIPGTANGGNSDGAVSLPDTSLHYVPFTYVGTIEAYKLTSATATTEEYAQQNKYPHSLFVADYAVTHTISWGGLNDEGLIFGKNYASGGVDYTLRAPSAGSNSTGSGESQHDTPSNNEWDRILDKNSGYIQNWNKMYSWGQDTSSAAESFRAYRGYNSARFWYYTSSSFRNVYLGFRPVLEVLNPGTLGSDGLKVVTLDLGGGKLGNSSEDIQIIVKTGSEFTAPASDGLTRPDGNTGSYFMWLGSNGKLYAPGDNVPADVTKLTAQFALSEQFSLKPGGTYYFDLSAMGIPGTVNTGNEDGAVSLPDTSLHYVPFTYAGTIEAYKLTSAMVTTEEYAQQNKYAHSLFVADYAVTHTISWGGLNDEGLIFGKNYASGGVDYTLRAPSAGSNSTGSGESQHDTPSNNEWDRILDKNSGYIQNWNKMYSWGQDTSSAAESFRAYRGYNSARFWYYTSSSFRNVYLGFRPVLEVLNPGTLGSDGLKVVTLDLGGGKLGNSSEDIQIIVKTGSEFTAPASDGLTRPDGDAGSFFMWLGSNGKFYVPGDSVPADVTALTVQWTVPTYAVTLHPNGGTINSGNVTGYTYGVGATLPTADDMTYTGHTFKGWYDNENLTGSPITAIGGTGTGNKEYWAKWEINQYTITVKPENGKADITITQDYGTAITAPEAPTREGYTFMGWDREIPTTMPAENITLKARWKDCEKPTGEIVIGTNKWQEFLNKITFGLFFKDTQTVTINAADNSGTVFVSYLVTDQDLSEAELQSLVFSGYEEPFCIDPNGEYIVYAMLVDESLNITYLRSDRITLDNVQPVITGIENGKTYCEAQTVTVDEKYVDTVTVNGTEVTLDENNSFTLSPADGEQRIIVTDRAGNTAEMTVTVNDGHTGGKATCTERAVCEVCGKAYGEPDPKNHTDLKHIPAKAATKTAGGNIEYWYCEDCDKYFADAAATKEIKQADTVTAKLSGAAKSPQTGGDSGVVTVLLLSGGAFICLVSRRKKHIHTV